MGYVSEQGVRRSGAPKLERGMAQDGKTQREPADVPAPAPLHGPPNLRGVPPKLPLSARPGEIPLPPTAPSLGAHKPGDRSANASARAPARNSSEKDGGRASAAAGDQQAGGRRQSKRRTAGPARAQVAANDDAPSIGGLIFALQQRPSNRAFQLAAAASGGWLAIGALLVWALLASEAVPAGGSLLTSPMTGGGGGDHRPADRAVLVPGPARLARPGIEAHVLGHDRGGRAPRRARSRRRAVRGLAGPGRAAPGLVHERGHLARARPRRRARGAGPQRGRGARALLQRERAQDQRSDPGARRRAPGPGEHHRQGLGDLEADGRRGAAADREPLPAADQARQDHRRARGRT